MGPVHSQKDWQERRDPWLTQRVDAGWQTEDYQITEPGWAWQNGFWSGPNNTGKWE